MAVGDKAIAEVNRIIASIPGAMFSMGEVAAKIIRDRTRYQNLDATGGAFAKYTDKYARRRGKTAVDLTDTGEMLDSITVLNSDGTRFDPRGRGSKFRGQPGNAGQFVAARDVEIAVGPSNTPHPSGMTSAQLSDIHQRGRGRMPVRQHIGLTEQEQDELARIVARELYQSSPTTEATTLNIRLG